MALALARTVSFLLLLALSCWCGGTTARPAPTTSDAAGTGTGAGAGFVKSWCAGTEYPALCDATLAPYATEVGTSAARLSWAALTVTLDGARDATDAMKGMAAAGHLAPVAAEAARDCVSVLRDAVDVLRQSVEAMARLGEEEEEEEKLQGQPGSSSSSSRNVRFQVDSVQTWASAALTDDDMCMEGFKREAAVVREAVRGHVVGVAHLTANALAIVKAAAKSIGVDICRPGCKKTTPPPPPTAAP